MRVQKGYNEGLARVYQDLNDGLKRVLIAFNKSLTRVIEKGLTRFNKEQEGFNEC